jgi:SAM-dependent methyltransferase
VSSRAARLSDLGLEMRNGLPRGLGLESAAQAQTRDTFGYKWQKRETYESASGLAHMRAWLIERYGDPESFAFLREGCCSPVLLDAGCGAGYSALELFGPVLDRIRYLGADISTAVDVARVRFRERNVGDAAFIQTDLTRLPIPDDSVDVIFSEGVLHHTDSTKGALLALSAKLKPGGTFMFYVYRKKGPIREFTDDYIREKLQSMSPDEAWKAVQPLSKFGKMLGNLDIEIDISEDIDLLDIPAGRINLQRFFYWHIFKAFYRPDMSLDEMNHINFDWYAPKNAHRQSEGEVRNWCAEAGLEIVRERVEEAGITIVTKKVKG